MKLKELKIERPMWGENVGKIVGSVKFEGDHGNICLQLTEDHCQKILEVCAGALVESAKQSAMQLAEAVQIAAAPVYVQLPNPLAGMEAKITPVNDRIEDLKLEEACKTSL